MCCCLLCVVCWLPSFVVGCLFFFDDASSLLFVFSCVVCLFVGCWSLCGLLCVMCCVLFGIVVVCSCGLLNCF